MLTVGFPEHSISLTLRGWVNDGLMAVFFFVIGLEIKRELVEGELREPRKAMLPVAAALGGMIVPALVYLAFNAGGAGSGGWGIPIATDTAMALGMVTLLGRRAAPPLKLFILALAIVDDIGAIVVITFFYSGGFNWGTTLLAVAARGRRHRDAAHRHPRDPRVRRRRDRAVARDLRRRASTRRSRASSSGCSRRPSRSASRT